MISILILVEFILNAIPSHWALGIGKAVGLFAYRIDRKHRRLAISNIQRALSVSPGQAKSIARDSFRNFGINIAEFFLRSEPRIEIIGYEHIRWDSGNIFVLGHFGNWEVLGRIAIKNGVQIVTVGREMKNESVDRYISSRRKYAGLQILRKKGSFKDLNRSLEEGKAAAILIDQYAGRRGVFIDFLGRPASTTHGPVLLALKTGCPVIPVFVLRSGDGYKIILEAPLDIRKENSIELNTKIMAEPLERYIRMYPEQWWWVHRRWR